MVVELSMQPGTSVARVHCIILIHNANHCYISIIVLIRNFFIDRHSGLL